MQQVYDKYSYKDNDDAEFALGMYFYTGFYDIPKDYVNAIKLFIKAKEHKNMLADCLIKNILAEIKKTELDCEDSCSNPDLDIEDEFFKQMKNPKALFLMGMVKEAFGMEVEAINLYIESAKKGFKQAKGRIGSILYRNQINLKEAEELLIESSGWKEKDDDDDGNNNNDDDLDLDAEFERKYDLFHLANLKISLKEDKKLDEAIEILKYLLTENNRHVDAALCLSIAYKEKGDEDNSEKYKQIAKKQFSSLYEYKPKQNENN